ncbi:DUF3108 domain-containing protein [Lutimaribacter marinistellae]|uniref:DUF3108 domain-containing protein n=1 Tax=Lutimaribacter marinistellae TaxID=1820329 RepID=A0ABV7TEB6_9RHOB
MRLLALVLSLSLLPAALAAQDTTGTYTVRALGVTVGQLQVSGRVTDNAFAVRAQFTTSGLVGAVKGVRFVMESQGARRGDRFIPSRYSEDMDTGRRESRVQLVWKGGVARATGSEVGDRGPYAVTDAQQKGAVDPLTAMFIVLRDQPRDDLCRMSQRIYDGERLTEIALTGRSEDGDTVTCTGLYRRVAGYSPEKLAEKSRFPLTVTYTPAGELMQMQSVRADTTYGPATITRR